MDSFLSWCSDNGIAIHPQFSFSTFDPSNWTVTSSTFLPQDDVLCSIPKRSLLTPITSSFLQPSSQHLPASHPSSHTIRLVLSLAYEISIAQKSRWWPYLAILPGLREGSEDETVRDELPVFWEEQSEERKWLKGTECERMLRKQRSEFDVLTSLYSLHYTDLYTLRTLKLAYYLVLTRAFQIDTKHGLGMVPVADLFNHRSGDRNHAQLESNDDSFTDPKDGETGGGGEADTVDLVLQRPFLPYPSSSREIDQSQVNLQTPMSDETDGKGEIFNTYGGELDSAHLFVKYGVLDEEGENERDRIRFEPWELSSLPPPTSDALNSMQRKVEKEEEDLIAKLERLDLVATEEHSSDASVEDQEGEDGLEEGEALYISYDAELSPALSRRVTSLSQLRIMCEERMKRYYKPDMEVEELLDLIDEARAAGMKNLVMAMQLALGERMVLRAVEEKCLDGEDEVVEGEME
ncbi:SET domain-containing protein [Atractiella rhizophila]|nr:SET domain-containing protein [Atractiella rhizophila]